MDCRYSAHDGQPGPGQSNTERRVCLGNMAATWDKIGDDRGLHSDSAIASFLLQYYEDTTDGDQPATCCANCLKPLSLACANCGTLQLRPGLIRAMQPGGSKVLPSGNLVTPQSPEKDEPKAKFDNTVDLLDTDPTSPISMQVARAMVQLSSFSAGGAPTPVISSISTPDKDGMHACPHCGCKFSHVNGLSRHLSLEICYTKSQEPVVIQPVRPKSKRAMLRKTIKCAECSLEFLEQEQLMEHMKIHTAIMPYKCSYCGVGFLKKHVLEFHLKTHQGRHTCHICKSEFVNAHGLTAHLKTRVCQKQGGIVEAALTQAGIITKPPPSRPKLTRGMSLNTNICKYCSKIFASPSHLKRHVLTHTGERPYVCQECGASFTQKSRLIDHHNRNHAIIKPIKCGTCCQKFFTTSELDKHTCQPQGNASFIQELNSASVPPDIAQIDFSQYQSGEGAGEPETDNIRPYKCQYCNAEFAFSTHLTAHIQKHTGQKEFKCQHCDKAFGDYRYLKQHLRKHMRPKTPQGTELKRFKCHQCGSAFRQKGLLKKHMRVHTGEKPYLCTHCGKGFAQRCNYRRHIRIHTGERPYKCKECGMAFAHYTTYIGHVRTHTGARPYKCRQCDKAFRQSYGLTIHMRTHTKEKPYKCTQCTSAFSHPSSLTVHMRTHTGEKPYKCADCGQSFATASNRTAHAKKTHGKQPRPKHSHSEMNINTNINPNINPNTNPTINPNMHTSNDTSADMRLGYMYNVHVHHY